MSVCAPSRFGSGAGGEILDIGTGKHREIMSCGMRRRRRRKKERKEERKKESELMAALIRCARASEGGRRNNWPHEYDEEEEDDSPFHTAQDPTGKVFSYQILV